MKNVELRMKSELAQIFCVGLFFIFHFSFSTSLSAQEPVAALEKWVATVDSATQRIVLLWQPSSDSATLGYHICTGNPCLDYDTVFGRLDTTYVCADHTPQERHYYRLHVFDSAYNVSALTPAFCNVVLEADVPECENTVTAHWTLYEGTYDYPADEHGPYALTYSLYSLLEPFDSTFRYVFSATWDTGIQEYSFDIPDSVTRVCLRVRAHRRDGFCSFSNIVKIARRTIDTASVVAIGNIAYDSVAEAVDLTCEVDTAFKYTLYRSIDGTPWQQVETFRPRQSLYHYRDTNINIYDSLHCYRLEVKDRCGLNPRFSNTACIVVPNPPQPGVAIPNVVVAGDDRNGVFLPKTRGLKGDLYDLTIYNRWGMQVYRSIDPAAGWTPTADTPQGAYVYSLRVRLVNNTVKTYTGTFLVLK